MYMKSVILVIYSSICAVTRVKKDNFVFSLIERKAYKRGTEYFDTTYVTMLSTVSPCGGVYDSIAKPSLPSCFHKLLWSVSSHHLIQPSPAATLSWDVTVPDNLGLMRNSV